MSLDDHDDAPLGQGRLLDRLPRFRVADLAGAELRLLLVEQRIELAAQTDAECRFKEQENQADQTDQPRDRAERIDHDLQGEHDRRQHDADDPGEFLLLSADILGRLVSDDQTPDDQRRRISRIDQDPDQDVRQEDCDRVFQERKIALEDRGQNRHEHKHKEEASSRSNLSLVQYGNVVSLNGFTEAYNLAHVLSFPFQIWIYGLRTPASAARPCRIRLHAIVMLNFISLKGSKQQLKPLSLS